jgi:WD40 repeat protein
MHLFDKILIFNFTLFFLIFLIFIYLQLKEKKIFNLNNLTTNFKGELKIIINRNSYEAFNVLPNDEIIGEYLYNNSDEQHLIAIWNSNNGNLKYVLPGHSTNILSILILDENLIASRDLNQIKIWDLLTKTLKHNLNTNHISHLINHNIYITTGHYSGLIQIWNCLNGSILHNITAHLKQISCLLFSIDTQILISSDVSGLIKVWNHSSSNLIKHVYTLKGHNKVVTSLSLLNKHNLLASSSTDKTIKIWNLNNGQLEFVLIGHTAEVIKVIVTNFNNIISADLNGEIKQWKFENNNKFYLLRNLTGHNRNIRDLIVLKSGQLISGDVSGQINLWNLLNGSIILNLNNPKKDLDRIKLFALSSGGLAVSSDDKTIKIWI